MRICIVGGSKGLGRAIADEAVCLTHEVTVIARSKPTATVFGSILADVGADLPRDYWPEAGTYDALIYNAGVGLDGLAVGQSEEELMRLWQVNVLGAMRCTKWYIRQRLGQQQPGIILFVSSVAGLTGLTGLAAYGSSKAALIGYAKGLARELGPKGWRVNALCPGFMATEMTQSLTAQQKASLARRTALGRLGTVEDVASVALFLLSDAAKWITGQAIVADGGFTC